MRHRYMVTEEVKRAYCRMARDAHYRPSAPGDGLGNITVPVEDLDIDEEALLYARQWLADEDERRYYLGCCDFRTRDAAIFATEAVRCMNGGLNDVALRLLQMAVADMLRHAR